MIRPLEPPYDEPQEAILSGLSRDGETPLGIFRLLAHNPEMFQAFLGYGSYNMSRRCSLSIHDRELVIFRSVARAHGQYEWGMHALLYTDKSGLTQAQVASTASGGADDVCWDDPRDRTIISAVDDLHDDDCVSASSIEKLEEMFSPAQILDFILIAGWYRTLATVTESLGLPLEDAAPRFPAVS